MANVLLASVGRSEGGVTGQFVGSVAGRAIDRTIGLVPNPNVLRVQSSAYGESIPRLFGSLRVSGNVLWSTGLREESASAKLGFGASSYSTSVAIGLSARPIVDVGRIWADGKLIRDADGEMGVAGSLRVYKGTEDQTADPVVTAVQGVTNAPAYRGTAYCVFEHLQLGEFGNRLPQLSFEVFADNVPPVLGAIVSDLAEAAGAKPIIADALTTVVTGYGIGGGASLGEAINQIALIESCDSVNTAYGVSLVTPMTSSVQRIGTAASGARVDGIVSSNWWRSETVSNAANNVEVGFFDSLRDYQFGQQRSSSMKSGGRTLRVTLPAVMGSETAKGVADRLTRESERSRQTRTLSVPYGYSSLETGDKILFGTDTREWRIRAQSFEGMVITFELESTASNIGLVPLTDSGTVPANPLDKQGPTDLRVLDLPAFDSDGGTSPRIWLAAGGGSAWRLARIEASLDDGQTYNEVGTLRRRSVVGVSAQPLQTGPADRWDRVNSLFVTLTNTDDWLESASESSVLSGANLALVGRELIQFANVEPLGLGKFKLSGLLRGRYGTEECVSRHQAGEGFVLIDSTRMLRVDLGQLAIGTPITVRATGPLDTTATCTVQRLVIEGSNLVPFSPVSLIGRRDTDGTVHLRWTRRSRLGSNWVDGIDTPLGESNEQYRISVKSNTSLAQFTCSSENLTISSAEQATMGVVGACSVEVAQISSLVGLGRTATINL